jgi:hypothetical protein
MGAALIRAATMPVLLIFLAAASADGQGVTVYVNRIVTAGPGDIRLGDLVSASGALPVNAAETLSRSVAVLADKALCVPAAQYAGLLEDTFGSDAIIVGSRTLILPRGMLPEGEDFIMDRLADFLDAQGLLGEGNVELALVQNQVRGTMPREGLPIFQLTRTTKGTCEVAFSLSGAGGSSVSGRVSLPAAVAPAASDDGVKAGISVRVFFHKGPVTIEMPGKTLSSARVGDQVSVSMADSQKRFSGTLMEGKAVGVDLP